MSTAISNNDAKAKKQKISPADAWRDARELVWAHRSRLVLGMLLMIVNRGAGMVLPASTKYLIDNVVLKHQNQLLIPLARAARHHRNAQTRTAARSPAANQVLRLDANRHTHFTNHV